jgi:hypothetical protein
MLVVNTNPFHAAARRVLFKHIPGQVQLLEFLDTMRCHPLDRMRIICSALDGHEPWMLGITNQPHRFPGRAETSFYLGTDGDPLYVTAQHLRQKIVLLMSPVKTDFVS